MVPLKKRLSIDSLSGTSAGGGAGGGGSSSAGAGGASGKVKSRVRSLKLPLSKKVAPSKSSTSSSGGIRTAMDSAAVHATVVQSDDDEDGAAVSVVATLVQSPGGTVTRSSNNNMARGSGMSKRRSLNPLRPVRIPPIASPGLLVPQSAATITGATSINNSIATTKNATTSSSAVPKVNSDNTMEGGSSSNSIKNSLATTTTTNSASGWITPGAIFEHYMKQAGYTQEARTLRPHRGSSTTRVVGDMFDLDVKQSLHFPPVIPPDLLVAKIPKQQQQQQRGEFGVEFGGAVKEANKPQPPPSAEAEAAAAAELPQHMTSALLRVLEKKRKPAEDAMEIDHDHGAGLTEQKRQRQSSACAFESMLPISLTVPYPESYIEKRLLYTQLVEAREKAIVDRQVAEEEAESRGESLDAKAKATFAIPPIPEPPAPPVMKEVGGFLDHGNAAHGVSSADGGFEDRHPLYLSKVAPELFAHVDINCFHITNGRYFGLMTNCVADPNFVGANAPGIVGVSASGGASLATSTTGTGGIATALTSSSYYTGTSINLATPTLTSMVTSSATVEGGGGGGGPKLTAKASPTSTTTSKTEATTSVKKTTSSPPSSTTPSLPKQDTAITEKAMITKNEEEKDSSSVVGSDTKPSASPTTTESAAKKPKPKPVMMQGPTPTATAGALRKIMEDGGDLAEAMKGCIIRAAVHASRSGRDGQPFIGSNGEVYPDISKAFAAHAGVKPCPRCKNNKQGAYHCRLRRKHQEPDYDGVGDSTATVRPLFLVPLESLILGNM
jgi:hypothetical protein